MTGLARLGLGVGGGVGCGCGVCLGRRMAMTETMMASAKMIHVATLRDVLRVMVYSCTFILGDCWMGVGWVLVRWLCVGTA